MEPSEGNATLNRQDMDILMPQKKATTPRRILTLKEKIKVIEAGEASGKSQRLLAADFGISKTQVMEILRNKDNIRMVVNENPDSKRLRLVKSRVKIMKKAKNSSNPQNGYKVSKEDRQGGDTNEQSTINSNQYGLIKALNKMDEDHMRLKVEKKFENESAMRLDHKVKPDKSEATVLFSFADDNLEERGIEQYSKNGRELDKAGCNWSQLDITGSVKSSTTSAVFPSFTDSDCETLTLKRIKAEPPDADDTSVANEKYSRTVINRNRKKENSCNEINEVESASGNLSTIDMKNNRISTITPTMQTNRNPISHSHTKNVVTPKSNFESKYTDKGCTRPSTEYPNLNLIDKIRLFATCKGKSQSQLANELGISEPEVFEILPDRDEIEMQFRYECIRQQQFANSILQPFYNNLPRNSVPDACSSQDEISTGTDINLMEEDIEMPSGIAGNTEDQPSPPDGSSSSIKRKRKGISVEDKMLILQNKGIRSLRETADAFGIGKTTVLDIFRRSHEITTAFHDQSLNPKRKKLRSWKNTEINYEMVDIAVFEWYQKVVSQPEGVFLSGPKVQKKAALIAKELGITRFKASNGWLSGFCRRHRVSFRNKRKKSSAKDGGRSMTFQNPDSPSDTGTSDTYTMPHHDADQSGQAIQLAIENRPVFPHMVRLDSETIGGHLSDEEVQIKTEPVEEDNGGIKVTYSDSADVEDIEDNEVMEQPTDADDTKD